MRLDSIPAGGVSAASVYGLEPFGTLVAEMKMTPADMRRMIVSKYNDPVNVKEAHRIDLISTTPDRKSTRLNSSHSTSSRMPSSA